MPLEIQIVSDLHLEFWPNKKKFNFIKPTAKILALLGDICCCSNDDDFLIFQRFIEELLPHYEHIIHIAGNHEYYTTVSKKTPIGIQNTIPFINEKIRSWFKSKSKKLHFLSNNCLKLTIDGKSYKICGTTLWTWIPLEHRKRMQSVMNDYSYIYTIDTKKPNRNKLYESTSLSSTSSSTSSSTNTPRLITSDDVADMFLKNVTYLKQQIIKAKKLSIPLIILTHHKPYQEKTYNANAFDSAYESDLSKLICSPVKLWAYGHTHKKTNIKINGVMIYSMPKGYPNQRTGFNPADKITIE